MRQERPAANAAPNSRTEEQAREKANDLEKKIAAGVISPHSPELSPNINRLPKAAISVLFPINDPQFRFPPR